MEPPTIPFTLPTLTGGGQTGISTTTTTTATISTTSCSGINPADTVQNGMSGGGRGGPPRGVSLYGCNVM
ncbi:hypothetical protein TWF706_003102 [Orbilia oligospora]|nr:hypothetical protein TWF706_003102 [Orbilia oligospora]